MFFYFGVNATANAPISAKLHFNSCIASNLLNVALLNIEIKCKLK